MHVASWGGSASTAELVRGDDAEAVRVTDAVRMAANAGLYS